MTSVSTCPTIMASIMRISRRALFEACWSHTSPTGPILKPSNIGVELPGFVFNQACTARSGPASCASAVLLVYHCPTKASIISISCNVLVPWSHVATWQLSAEGGPTACDSEKLNTQRLQYPLTKEYSLNHIKGPTIIESISLN